MAGLTPFQFSSRKIQESRAIGPLGSTMGGGMFGSGGLAGETYQTLLSWYEMWLNPSGVDIQYTYKQNTQHTAAGIVTFHYRKDLATMKVSGAAGWVAIQSDIEMIQDGLFGLLRGNLGSRRSGHESGISGGLSRFGKDFMKGINPFKNDMSSNRLNNSPRKYLQRIQDLANEPTYYVDNAGRDHYNTKYIKIFTKAYPNGMICEGFFKDFHIPESAEDTQTINYDFTFVIENFKPVTLLQRVAGMFAGATSAIGDLAGIFGG